MQDKSLSVGLRTAVAVFAVVLLGMNSYAATEKVLYSFTENGADGLTPYAGLVFDANGNLYGTTSVGGSYGDGTAFELTPAGGGWTEKVLHSFSPLAKVKDGAIPYAGLVSDGAGNLYGTTVRGGKFRDGAVFELTPQSGGNWSETRLHSFNGTNGDQPFANLIFDASGNLYGTTSYGGAYNDGRVFELMPRAGGVWIEKVLRSFNSKDGANPQAGLIFDASGNLYGTTYGGGAYGRGVVFELSPKAGGGWTEKVLHHFAGSKDGYYPLAGLILDKAGNLYGTTFYGGAQLVGTVFELTPKAGGRWTEKVLHSFGAGSDGTHPQGVLIFDASGNLYGTTTAGGVADDGTVFELTPKARGGWTEKILHSFLGHPADGAGPSSGLIFDAAGNLYGTTYSGGANDFGTVFEVMP